MVSLGRNFRGWEKFQKSGGDADPTKVPKLSSCWISGKEERGKGPAAPPGDVLDQFPHQPFHEETQPKGKGTTEPWNGLGWTTETIQDPSNPHPTSTRDAPGDRRSRFLAHLWCRSPDPCAGRCIPQGRNGIWAWAGRRPSRWP